MACLLDLLHTGGFWILSLFICSILLFLDSLWGIDEIFWDFNLGMLDLSMWKFYVDKN